MPNRRRTLEELVEGTPLEIREEARAMADHIRQVLSPHGINRIEFADEENHTENRRNVSVPNIAILSWGSLLWDPNPYFDAHHGEWWFDGPSIPLEFSRISRSRENILTPVVDPFHGAPCTVAYTFSTREDFHDVICDLRCREGVLWKYVHWIDLSEEDRYPLFGPGPTNTSVPPNFARRINSEIESWMRSHNILTVVWTGTQQNWRRTTGSEFTVEGAIKYVRGLPESAKTLMQEYFSNLPNFVVTPFLTEYRQLAGQGQIPELTLIGME